MIKILKKFQKAFLISPSFDDYLCSFEDKMIYRTTKSENPEIKLKVVKIVLQKLSKTYAQKTR